MVGQHAPEAAQGFSRDAWSKLGDIPLQIGADKVLPPAQATGVIKGKQTFRETTAHPQHVRWQVLSFQHLKGRKLKIGNASSQSFTSLLEQIKGSGTEQQI